MRAKIEIEQDIQHINQELDILSPLQADENNPEGSVSQEVDRLHDKLKVLEQEFEQSNRGIIFNPEEEDMLDAEIEADLEAEMFADDIETTKVHFYRDGGEVYATSSQIAVSKEEVIDLANSVTSFDRSQRGADEIDDIDGALSILRTKYPEYAELDSSDFYDDEEMDQKFDDYALSSYAKGGKVQTDLGAIKKGDIDKYGDIENIYYEVIVWGVEPKEGESDDRQIDIADTYSEAKKIAKKTRKEIKKGENIVIYAKPDLEIKTEVETIRYVEGAEDSYGVGGMLAGFVVGGYAGYKYGLTKRQRNVRDLFSEEKKFAEDYKRRKKKQKEEREKRGEPDYTDFEEIYAKGGVVEWKFIPGYASDELKSLNDTAIYWFNQLSQNGIEQYEQELKRLKKSYPYRSGTENWEWVADMMNGFDAEYGEGKLKMRGRSMNATPYRYGLQIIALESSMKDNGLKEYAKGGEIYSVEYWETEEDRDTGEGQMYMLSKEEETSKEKAIARAKNLFSKQNFASVEVLDEDYSVVFFISNDTPKGEVYAKGGSVSALEVTSIKYKETRRGISYIAQTNKKGLRIVNDGSGGDTFVEGVNAKNYRDLTEQRLESLIDDYESKNYAKGGKVKRFDRHKSMSRDTLEKVGNLIAIGNKDIEFLSPFHNSLFGLFDGYNYYDTQSFQEKLSKIKKTNPPLGAQIEEVYKEVNKYPEGENEYYAKGGKTSKFWKKTKELGKKGWSKSKELAHEANERRKEHLHFKRKENFS